LGRQRLASEQSLIQTERELANLQKHRSSLAASLKQEQGYMRQDQGVLEKQLGQPLAPGQVPETGLLRAPLDGYVLWMHNDLRVGSELRAQEPIMQVGVMDPMLIRTRVYEIEALQLKVGEKAEVQVESLPDRQFTAQVSQIPWSTGVLALEHPSYYEVEFKVPNPDLVLKEGLKAKVMVRKAK
jgi:multidrug efflux pump subunit AcrA (membrane-fusion protein)